MFQPAARRPQIEKIRHVIKDDANNVVWELDEFFGDNEGLIVAEVELASETQVCTRGSAVQQQGSCFWKPLVT